MADFNDYSTKKPAIFADMDWVVYAETHRGSEPLDGNFSDRSGVMNEENYTLLGSTLPYEEWKAKESQAVKDREEVIKKVLGLKHISHPNPDHDTALLTVDGEVTAMQASLQTPVKERPVADALETQMTGYGLCISPADCIVINVANPETHAVGQIHAGYEGLRKGIITKVLHESANFNPKMSRFYLAAHAHEFPLYGPVLDEFRADPVLSPYIDQEGELHMTQLALDQLKAAGVSESQIQVDSRDTFTDPQLFSHRQRQQKGANGRNGIIIGIVA